jgi:hypothetical protein
VLAFAVLMLRPLARVPAALSTGASGVYHPMAGLRVCELAQAVYSCV